MKVLSVFTTAALLSVIGVSVAKEDAAYVYGKDPKKDAEYDISMGMAGIQQAAQDPKLLAQLFQDMQVSFCLSFLFRAMWNGNADTRDPSQRRSSTVPHPPIPFKDPELMAEAKKMMESPDWKKKMKELTNDKSFKSNIENVKKTLEDPDQAAKMQAKMEHMLKVGQGAIKTEAKDTMTEAMQAMADPEVMAEAARMMKDPQFQQQLSQMAKDPSFKKYVSAMQDMMQDPTTKAQMEQMAGAFRSKIEL